MTSETTPRKMLRILDLIEESYMPVTPDVLIAKLGFTRSTLYRHLKILTESGLISSIPEYGYTFGPRITELDYRMRQRDPLIRVSKSVMAELAGAERGVALLCRRYKDRILCIHQEQGATPFRSNYERGLARPLFRGATSRIVLAHLRQDHINRLQARFAEEFAAAGLGSSAAEVRESLRQMRKQGFDVTQGQVTPGVTGIAVPLFDVDHEVLGSLSLTIAKTALPEAEIERLVERLKFGAAIIRHALERDRMEAAVPGAA
jgi:DNA-binding IclR family transcriptional regulator